MLRADIAILEKRQKALEKEIGEALTHAPTDDPMVANLKTRILYVKDEIRHQLGSDRRVTISSVLAFGRLIYQFAEPTKKLSIQNVFNVVGVLTHKRVKLPFQ